MLTLSTIVSFIGPRLAVLKKVPLWIWELLCILAVVAVALWAFARHERQVGVLQTQVAAARVIAKADSARADSAEHKAAVAIAAHDTTAAQLSVALVQLDTAQRSLAVWRAKVPGVSKGTPDTVYVTVQAGFVKACDLVTATCDEVRAKAIRDSVAAAQAISGLQNHIASLQTQLADAVTKPPGVEIRACPAGHPWRDGAIGAGLGAIGALWVRGH